MFAQIIFPNHLEQSFTYSIPEEFIDYVSIGKRVLVSFGKIKTTGFVFAVSEKSEIKENIKPILDVLDDFNIFNSESLRFYEWISDYYVSSLGEALKNAIPYGIEVESKKKIVTDKNLCADLYYSEKNKTTLRAKVLSILAQKEVHTISSIQKSVKSKNIYSLLKSLEKVGAISILDQLDEGKVRVKKIKHISLAKPLDEIYDSIPQFEKTAPKQALILLELISEKELPLSELLKKVGSSISAVKNLLQKGFVKIHEVEVDRTYREFYQENSKTIVLSAEQNNAIKIISESIEQEIFESYLLYGVTASGKTQVYIELAKKALTKNKTVIILVPEISLTPQITSRFINNFGEITTVIHSRLSLGERYDAWRGIIKGKYKVVIGPRSALFAPLKNIGLIVVDEEHDGSYKQNEISPKYNARDSAIIRAKYSNCPVVLGSATPSLESMQNAIDGKYKLIQLKNRIDNAKLPEIKLIDIQTEKKKGKMENIFSKVLIDEIANRLARKESVILLQNRRGFSTQVYCEDCGTIEMCKDCEVSLIHHISRNILQCHYCGFTKSVPKICSVCGSKEIKFYGAGTQKVEDELSYYFPDAKIQRVDSDIISGKSKLSLILNDFKKGEIDILVGTQLVAKGLDFSNVTLVGVTSAETTLWLPDFRADERTFQLLTQVAGRAGRSDKFGEVIIQTQNSKNFVLQKVAFNDYPGFFENEIKLRKSGLYPPFSRLAIIEVKDESEEKAFGAIRDFYELMLQIKTKLKILPPNPAIIPKIKGQYRFQLLIKSPKEFDPSGKQLRSSIRFALKEFRAKSKYKSMKINIDIDPMNII